MLSGLSLNWTWTCIDMCLMHKSSAPVQWSTTLSITLHLTACPASINYTCFFPVCLWQEHSWPLCHLCQRHRAQAQLGWRTAQQSCSFWRSHHKHTSFCLGLSGKLQVICSISGQTAKTLSKKLFVWACLGRLQDKNKQNLVTWNSMQHLKL